MIKATTAPLPSSGELASPAVDPDRAPCAIAHTGHTGAGRRTQLSPRSNSGTHACGSAGASSGSSDRRRRGTERHPPVRASRRASELENGGMRCDLSLHRTASDRLSPRRASPTHTTSTSISSSSLKKETTQSNRRDSTSSMCQSRVRHHRCLHTASLEVRRQRRTCSRYLRGNWELLRNRFENCLFDTKVTPTM